MEKSKNGNLMKGIVVVTYAAMVIINALANILPINGVNTGQVSDSYPNLFAPAGLTFSIWGVIYLLLLLHTLYQAGLLRGKEEMVNDVLLRKVAAAFSISSLVNIAWIFSWHYKAIYLSLIFIVCLLVCLIYIAHAISEQTLSTREKLLVRLPFSVYFGWITVATIANVTTFLVSIEWDGFGINEPTWTVIILIVGALIGISTAIRFKDIAYNLVLIWAYFGIWYKHTTTFSNQYTGVIITVIACMALFAGTLVYILISGKRKQSIK